MTRNRTLSLGLTATLLISGASVLVGKPAPAKVAPTKAGEKKGALKPAALAAPVKVTSVEGITEYRLANGLRVLLFPDASKASCTVNITYLVGSRNENYGETGMAHLLEHLVFKGTPKHLDIPKELTEHGTRPNGSTAFDRTNYFESFQATDENLKWALELEADRMVNSFISKKDLWNPETQKGEMSVVRNEFEMGENNPTRVLMQRVQGAAYQFHAYGRSPIGCRADIENVNEARLQAFYHTYYQPDNAVLLVAGKFDEAKTLQLINGCFGVIPKPSRAIQPTYTLEPTQDGDRFVTVRRVGDVQWAMAAYHVPSGSDPDFAAIEVLTQILGDTPTGRLHKALVETKKATMSFASPMQLKEPGIALFGFQARKDANLDEVKEAFLKELETPAKLTFKAEEVDRAKLQILKQVDLALNDAENVGLFLSEYIALGDWRTFFLDRDRVKAVTPADVERVAKAYLRPSNRTMGCFLPTEKPERAEIPAMKDVAAMVKDYKGQAAVAQGEVFDSSPKAIAQRAVSSTLSSGAKLVVVPKKTRGGSVAFSFRFHLGDEKNLAGKAMTGSLLGRMLMRGTLKHSRAEMADLFDKAKANINISGDVEEIVVTGETTKEHVATVMGLIAETLKEPGLPEAEFEQLRQQLLARYEAAKSEPQVMAQYAFNQLMNPYPAGHVRAAMSLDEQMAELKRARLEDLKAFQQTFYGSAGAALAIVGDVDAKEVQALMQTSFGDWKAPVAYARIEPGYQPKAGQVTTLEAPDKPNAFFMAGLPVQVQDDKPDFPALCLGNFMLGGGFLNSRLATRIRQKEGLSYHVASNLDASVMSKATLWSAIAIYAPQNLQRLETAFQEELAKALKDGFTQEEIKAAKSGWLQERKVARSQDGELAGMLAWNLPTNRPLAFEDELDQKVSDLTNEQIVTVLRKYIDPAKLVIVKAGDFAKVQPKP